LFIQRNSDGSKKELTIWEEVMDRVLSSHSLVNKGDSYDTKFVMKELDFVVNNIKDLQSRKYVQRIYLIIIETYSYI
jgi:hypothetical protein